MHNHYSRRQFISALGAGGAAVLCDPFFFRFPVSAAARTNKTGYAYDPYFMKFYQTPEVPERVQWINNRIVSQGLQADCTGVTAESLDAARSYIAKVHNAEHISGIKNISAGGSGYLPVNDVAEAAVASVLGAVKGVCEGAYRNAFCAIRPPGHHALNSGGGYGYCYYANIIIALRYAREKFNIKKVLIVDWDYHHGNGTHSFLCGDNDVLFFDIMGTDLGSTNCGDYTIEDWSSATMTPSANPDDDLRINIRMPFGSNNAMYREAFEKRLVPVAERFKPELVLVSCGFDAKMFDTHNAAFEVTARGFSYLTKAIMDIADIAGGGKVVSVLEGGYADDNASGEYNGLAGCAAAHVATLLSGEIQPEDPFFAAAVSLPGPLKENKWTAEITGGTLRLRGLQKGKGVVSIVSMEGKTLQTWRVSGVASASFDLGSPGLPAGKYLVIIQIADRTKVVPFLSFE